MIPLNHKIKKMHLGFKLSRLHEKVNYLMYMDDNKLIAKNEKRTGNSKTRS